MRAGYWLTASCKLAPDKSIVRLTVTFDMPIAIDQDVLFVCFVALRPTSTAMAMVGRSVHLNTLFPGQA